LKSVLDFRMNLRHFKKKKHDAQH